MGEDCRSIDTLVDLFEQQVARGDSGVAVVHAARSVTYGELDGQANRIARFLAVENTEPGERVALALDRGPLLIAGMLGIMKAGCAYVPLEPADPADRLGFILGDSGSRLVLCDTASAAKLESTGQARVVLIEDLVARWDTENYSERHRAVADGLAYVIYTSGTTGQPKGCQVTHANVVSLFRSTSQLYDLTERDTWVMAHSQCFDVSVWEIFGALVKGGRLLLVDWATVRDPRRMLEAIKREGVTVLCQTPAAFYGLIQAEEQSGDRTTHQHLRYVVLAGERLDFDQLVPWWRRYGPDEITLVNMYGPTEITVYATYYRIRGDEPERHPGASIIGEPIPGTAIYVCGENLTPVPDGEPGEMFVAGPGVTRGYLNRPELTEQRFIPSPFVPGKVLYRTGDLVRRAADGQLFYLGRNDDQVKIRGYRIELEEVRYQLLRSRGIRQAVVLPNDRRTALVAFVIAGDDFMHDAVLADLRRRLPAYMIPGRIVRVESFPLTTNGKVDKQRLLAEDERAQGVSAEGALEGLELSVAEAFGDVLKIRAVGEDTDFIAAGGNSVDAAGVAARLRARGYEVEVADILERRTPKRIASEMRLQVQEAPRPVDLAPRGRWPITYFQNKYVQSQMHDPGSKLGISVYPLMIRGPLNEAELVRSLRQVVSRHRILHATVAVEGEAIYQQPMERWNLEVPTEASSSDESFRDAIAAAALREFTTPFDIFRGIPLRARLLRHDPLTSCLVLTFPHISVDRQSVSLFVEELLDAYGRVLPEESGQGADFGTYALQQHAITRQPAPEVLAFWEAQIRRARTSAPGPGWREGPAWQYEWLIEGELYQEIREFSKRRGLTPVMFFLASFLRFLNTVLQLSVVTAGATISARQLSKYRMAIGPILNHGLFTSDMVDTPGFVDLCEQVRSDLMAYMKCLEFPIEYFREHPVASSSGGSTASSPFDFLLNYYDRVDQDRWESGDLSVALLPAADPNSTMLRRITLNVYETSSAFRCKVRCREELAHLFQQSGPHQVMLETIRSGLAAIGNMNGDLG